MKHALLVLLPLLSLVPSGSVATPILLGKGPVNGCPIDTSQADFQAGVPTNLDLTTSPGNVLLLNAPSIDQQNTSVTASSFAFTSTSWFGQTFTVGTSGQLTQVDVDLFCSSCTGTTPNLTVSIRNASGDLPTGVDLATATIPGFSSSSGGFFSATFVTPVAVTAGTSYALVVRAVSNPSVGTYSYVVSTGSPYAGGRRVTSGDSGATWAGQATDIGFKVYVKTGFASAGDLISSVKDSHPPAGFTPVWPTLSWTASTPANTALRFQAAGSNAPTGPFNFVGPDGTGATFFTTNGTSLDQFDGKRYLKYRAYLSTTDTTVTPTLNDVTVCFMVVSAPDLSIAKSDGGASVAPGGTVAYTLTYANAGGQTATGVVLMETVPANTTFNPGASTAGWACTPSNAAGSTCTLAVGSVAAGGGSQIATFAVTVVNPVAAGVSQIANTATLADDGTHGADPTPGNNSGGDTTPVTGAPDLSIAKSDGGASVAPGGTLAYTLTFANSGSRGATGVILTETVPANTTFNPGASTGGWVCSPNNNAGSTCTLAFGALAAGGGNQSATFVVTVATPLPGGVSQIANTATLADDGTNGTDPNLGNNTSSINTPVTGGPDLSITKSDGGVSVAPGGAVSYTLTYANSGNRGATGVVLTETVPASTTFNAGASTAGWVCTPNANAGSTCTLAVGAVVAGDGNHTATFTVTVANPLSGTVTQIDNTATIADDGTNGTDPNPGNNTGSDSTPVRFGFFYTLTPCRLVDTRNPNGPYGGPALAALSTRTFVAAGQCGVPANVKAVSFNLTLTQGTAAGDVRLYPAGIATPPVSVINYVAAQTRANNGIVGLGVAGDFVVRSDQQTGTVQVILDVNGYFQ